MIIKSKKSLIQVAVVVFLISACANSEKGYDASGSFEVIERTISAEATGKIKSLKIEEGQLLIAGDTIGSIDVSNLTIQSEQVKSSIKAINQKTNSASSQILVLQSQLKTQESQVGTMQQQITNINSEVERFQKLVEANAVPQKQLDDLVGQKLVLQKQLASTQTQSGVIQAQIDAAKANVHTQNRAILSEIEPNKKRLALIEKQIKDGIIINEYDGTVTTQIAYDGEFTSIGRPMYRIADLSNINLRAYVSGNQLPLIKLNQEVIVRTDDGNDGFKETKGTISWISSKAEFTPKTIQTKDERANLVYAIKIRVENDGTYKMGMYGEVRF
ncbi:MAG: HlyD family secretion protein [Saprospiraceae bacterium]|jgi:HlyD family secretion protein|tara:strand:+ start:948 stop:1937 length:990 start_codon:yes stop_codon:yes gene_type:complete